MSGKQPPTRTSISSGIGTASEIDAAFYAWADRVDEAEAKRIYDLVMGHDLSTQSGMMACIKTIIAETLNRQIAPSVSTAILPWMQLLATQLQIAAMTSGVGDPKRSVLSVALEMRQKVQLKPSFSREIPENAPDVINADEMSLEGEKLLRIEQKR